MIAIRYPNEINAPGASTNTSIPYSSGKMRRENSAPVPRNSRTMPSKVKPKVKPSPMPNPSQNDAKGLFLAANASARPSTMQFTTIRGMNNPSES